jgi:hypothetical protein
LNEHNQEIAFRRALVKAKIDSLMPAATSWSGKRSKEHPFDDYECLEEDALSFEYNNSGICAKFTLLFETGPAWFQKEVILISA